MEERKSVKGSLKDKKKYREEGETWAEKRGKKEREPKGEKQKCRETKKD